MARVERVLTGNDLKQQSGVCHGLRHRTGVVEGVIDADDTRVWNEAMGRLEPHDATPGCGNANGAPLVPADRQVNVIIRQCGPRTARRTASHMVGIMLIAGRAIGAGMTATREGKIVHIQDGGNLAAGIEDAGDNSGINIRHIIAQHQRGTRHRNTGNTHIVLNTQTLPGQLARRGALD